MIHKLLLAALFILACSCSSSDSVYRYPSSISDEGANLSGIFEIKVSPIGANVNAKPITHSELKENESTYKVLRNVQSDLEIRMVETEELASDVKFKLDFDMDLETNKLKLTILSNSQVDDLGAHMELRSFISTIFTEATFNTVYDAFESSLNAKLGDLEAHKAFLLMRMRYLEELKDMDLGEMDEAFYEGRSAELRVYDQVLSQKLSEQSKIIKAEEAARKAPLAALDKAGEMEQLRGLVAQGKRKEVADLISKYLPWEKMPPLERLFWEENLKYMADPLPIEERMLVFRGIDGDMTYAAVENGEFLTKEVSEERGSSFLMSSILTKNQGTWNRRLRSLETMLGKVITMNAKTTSNTFTKTSRISTMMYQHSLNPSGSPFLSYTPSIKIAERFGKKRMAALLLDPRMTYANFSSAYKIELEFLTTLVTFPDEMVAIYDKELMGETLPGLYFKTRLKHKFEAHQFSSNKASEHAARLMEEAKEMNSYSNVHALQNNSSFSNTEKKPGIFKSIVNGIKSLFTKAKEPDAVIPASVTAPPTAKVSKCTNIIELFFKNSAKVH